MYKWLKNEKRTGKMANKTKRPRKFRPYAAISMITEGEHWTELIWNSSYNIHILLLHAYNWFECFFSFRCFILLLLRYVLTFVYLLPLSLVLPFFASFLFFFFWVLFICLNKIEFYGDERDCCDWFGLKVVLLFFLIHKNAINVYFDHWKEMFFFSYNRFHEGILMSIDFFFDARRVLCYHVIKKYFNNSSARYCCGVCVCVFCLLSKEDNRLNS